MFAPPPPFSARVARPPGGGQGGWGSPSGPPTDSHPPAPFPLSRAHPRHTNHPQPQHSALILPPNAPVSPVLCSCVVCASCPSKHIIRYLLIHIPPPNSPRARLSLPCPPHNIAPPAHFVHRGIRFSTVRFARTLPSSLARIHRIQFTISPRPEPQAPARRACSGGCDRMIVFSTVR